MGKVPVIIATVRFEGGELDLVLVALHEHKKNVPPKSQEKYRLVRLIDKLTKIRTART